MLTSVSFFCPAYYDEKNLPQLIPSVSNFLKSITDHYEIIIIEDGSPDNTAFIADQIAATDPCVRVIHHKINRGYGATLKEGFHAARYDYVVYTDGDNQYDINDLKPYIPLLSVADVLSGYAEKKAVTFKRKFQSEFYNICIKLLFGVNIRDINCALKVYKKEFINSISITSSSAFIDAEMLIKATRMKSKIHQFPVQHKLRLDGLASGSRLSVIRPTIYEMIRFKLFGHA